MIEFIAANSRPMHHVAPVAQHRLDNVLMLIQRLDGGVAKAFIKRTNISGLPLYIAKAPWRNFGSTLARRIEKTLNLESGILDIPQSIATASLDHLTIAPAAARRRDRRPARIEPKHRARQRNLSCIITFLTNGAIGEFEGLFGLSCLSNRLSRNATRTISDTVANRIEGAMRLPKGLLERDDAFESMIAANPLPDTASRVRNACQKLAEQLRWRLASYNAVCDELNQFRHDIQQELIAIAREDGRDRDVMLFDAPSKHLPELGILSRQCTILMEDSPTSNSVCVIMPVAHDRESQKHLDRARAALDKTICITPHIAWRILVPSSDTPWELAEYHGHQRVDGGAPPTRTRTIQSLTRSESISKQLESLCAATDSELLSRSWIRRTARNLATAEATLHASAVDCGPACQLLRDAEARAAGIIAAVTSISRVIVMHGTPAVFLPLGVDSLDLPGWRDALNEQLKANPAAMAAFSSCGHDTYALTLEPLASLLGVRT